MKIFYIAQKDIRSSFVTPLAYVVIAGFALLSGFFFFTLLQQYNGFVRQAVTLPNLTPNLNEWVIYPYYQTLEIILIFLVPVLTMRTVAEEKRTGTFELLMTSPVTVLDVVFGKALGLAVVLLVMLSCSLVFPVVLTCIADLEIPPMLIGFFGLMLFAAAFSALGIAVSACVRNQTVAGVISLVTLLLFYTIDAPAAHFGGIPAQILSYLSPSQHAEPLLKGILFGSDVLYFMSVISFGLFVAIRVLETERQ